MHPIFRDVRNTKKNVYLRIKRCDVSLSAPFSATLFKGKMQPCVPTVNLLPQSSR